MQAITDFADQAVVLPLTLAIGLTLFALGRNRAARAWTLAVFGTLAVMLVLKVVFLAFAPNWPDPALLNPSGHTAAAAAVYGGLAWLLGIRWAWLVAMAVAALIGRSRVALHMHSPADVMLGAAVGIFAALAFTALAGPTPRHSRRWPLLAATALVLVGFHGHQLGAEVYIVRFAAAHVRPLVAGAFH